MTRETKIGLLVGLAFIIVIGILLSDHFTSITRPPQASGQQTAQNVLTGVSSPGARLANAGVQPLIVPNVEPRQPVQPDHRRTGAVDVEVRGPLAADAPLIEFGTPQRGQDPVADVRGSGMRSETPDPALTGGVVDALPQTGVKEYKAEPGDTLTKILSRQMGGNTKANRDAFLKANPGIKDPAKLRAGETYIIPVRPTATASSVAPPSESDVAAVRSPATRPAGSTELVVYTTRQGDTLWRIASEHCGSGAAVDQIIALNKDVLKKGHTIQPNMKLKLPPKTVASAN